MAVVAPNSSPANDYGVFAPHSGKSPTAQKGPYKGQELSVDHIIPRTVVPELDNVIANLELLPLRLNESKNAKIGDRQILWLVGPLDGEISSARTSSSWLVARRPPSRAG
jgi:hypothetical protein